MTPIFVQKIKINIDEETSSSKPNPHPTPPKFILKTLPQFSPQNSTTVGKLTRLAAARARLAPPCDEPPPQPPAKPRSFRPSPNSELSSYKLPPIPTALSLSLSLIPGLVLSLISGNLPLLVSSF